MAQVSRSWFFQITATLIDAGKRFLTLDVPDEQAFRNLTDSVVMKSEVGDRAKVDIDASSANLLAGHVVAANDTQSLNYQAPKNDRTLAVQPHQLPIVVSDANQTVGAYTGPTITVTEANVVTSGNTKKSFKVKIPDALLTVLSSITGAVYATNAEVLARTAVSKSVTPNQVPTVSQGSDDTILDFTGKTISVTETPATDHNKYDLKLTPAFSIWLASKLPGNVESALSLYVAPNGSDTSGNGSVITPFQTLKHAIDVSNGLGTSIPIVVLGGTYPAITSPLPSFNNVITFADGALITYNDATTNRFLFTGSAGFSIRGKGVFTVSSAGSFFFNYTANYGKVLIEVLSITSQSALFKFASGNSAPYAGIRLLNGTITCSTDNTNLFVTNTASGTLNADIVNESVDADLTGGYYEIIGCFFSKYALRTKNHTYVMSFIRNTRFYHTYASTSMKYIIQGSSAGSSYCLTLENVFFDNASRIAGSSNIYLRTGSQPLVMRSCVFDRGKLSDNTAISVDAESAISIYAVDCIDTLALGSRTNTLGSNVTNSIGRFTKSITTVSGNATVTVADTIGVEIGQEVIAGNLSSRTFVIGLTYSTITFSNAPGTSTTLNMTFVKPSFGITNINSQVTNSVIFAAV